MSKETTKQDLHSVIAALEKEGGRAVALSGFIGSAGNGIVRVYRNLDTSDYIGVDDNDVLHIESGAERTSRLLHYS